MLRPIPQEIVYKGTISDLRISAVDGTAFIDNCAAITAYADNAHRVEIYDSAGKRLVGIAKEAGSGETVNNVVAGWDFTDSWGVIYDVTIDDANSFTINSGTVGVMKKNSILSRYKLYKSKFSTSTTPDDIYLRAGSGTCLAYNDNTYLYRTNNTDDNSTFHLRLYAYGIGTTDVAILEVNEVLTPSTDGIIIVNAKGGSTENFLTQDTGFSYNAASYTVIVKKLRG